MDLAEVIALVGDGAMQMNNMAELITAAKYHHKWPNQTFVVCVLNNQDLNQVTWEQRVMNGNPKADITQKLPDVPYHKFAELIGFEDPYDMNVEARRIFCNPMNTLSKGAGELHELISWLAGDDCMITAAMPDDDRDADDREEAAT